MVTLTRKVMLFSPHYCEYEFIPKICYRSSIM